MATLSFGFDAQDVARWKDEKVTRAFASAIRKAGGDAARFLRTGGSKIVRAKKKIALKRVREALTLTFPKGRRIEDLTWRMDVSGAPVPVAAFPHRQTKRGVSVAINQGARALIRSAFVATMRSGHRGVFTRAGPGSPRLPIKELFSTRVSDVFRDNPTIPTLFHGARSTFESSFTRLLPLELAKLKRP
jgi:hypothetical protein